MKSKVLFIVVAVMGVLALGAVDGVVNATALNARLRPELASPVAMKIAKDTVVNVLATKGNFYEIAVPENAPVYVSAAYIGQDGKLFKDQQLRVKPAVSAASYGVIPAGTAVETVKVDRYGWARIKPPKALKLYVASFYVDLKGKLEEVKPAEKQEEAKPAPAAEVKEEKKAAAAAPAAEVKEEKKAEAPAAAPAAEVKEEKKSEVPAEKKPEVKKEQPQAVTPVLPAELIKLNIDVNKGEKVSAKGSLVALTEKTVNCVQYALTEEKDGKLEVLFFISVPDDKNIDDLKDKQAEISGTAYTVPQWKKRILRLESFKEIKN